MIPANDHFRSTGLFEHFHHFLLLNGVAISNSIVMILAEQEENSHKHSQQLRQIRQYQTEALQRRPLRGCNEQ